MVVDEKKAFLRKPVPELPVSDVERAQQYYRDVFGFEMGWITPGLEMGAVIGGETTLFFRKREGAFEPVVQWVFAQDIDATYEEMQAVGAKVVEALEMKPWGLRQFAVRDLDGNVFYVHGG
jgi:uncharacterized glyoxalase superfamily protein PhnB